MAHPKDIWLLFAADLMIDMFIAEIDRRALCMQESQSIEWKWTWQDEYLKWLCGYANEEGSEEPMTSTNMLSAEAMKSVDRMMDILSRRLSDKEKAKMLPIVEYLKVHDEVDTQTVKIIIGKSRATASRYIQRLVELDILEKKGDSVTTVFYRK
ncbi:MAG: hypothetical protein LUH53_02450 [Lachnospiraceae bacterium]|nr:hypothetical protein [Lachnospiraceae bacterium]